MKRRIPIILIVLFLVVGCQSISSNEPKQNIPENIIEIADACDQPVDFGFNYEIATRTPADIDISLEEGISYPEMGQRGANEIANELTGGVSYCDLSLSIAAEEILEQALQTAQAGDTQAARKILLNLLTSSQSTNVVFFVSQTLQSTRQQTIRDLLRGAELDMLLGGDGQTLTDAAKQAFHDFANNELSSADLQETMAILEDAMRLGDDEIEQQGRERAEKIVSESLDAAIADFDPCTAEKEDIKDLLNKLATAQLFGILDAQGDGGARYDQAVSEIRMAAQRLFNEAARKANLPELIIPVPACEISGEIEVMLYKPYTENVKISVGRIPFKVLSSEFPAEVEGKGNIFFQDSVPMGECSFDTNIDAEVVISGTFTMTGKAGQFNLEVVFGEMPDYGQLNCPGLSGATLTLPELTYPVQFPYVDNTTREVSGIHTLILHLNTN